MEPGLRRGLDGKSCTLLEDEQARQLWEDSGVKFTHGLALYALESHATFLWK